MSNFNHTLVKLNHNNVIFWAHGATPTEAENRLKNRVNTALIGFDMFSNNPRVSEPEHFKIKTQNIINEATASRNKNVFNLSGMANVLERKINISEAVSQNVTSDTLRGWMYIWTSSLRNSTGIGIEARISEDLRWLITDNGFYIEKNYPSENSPKSNNDRRLLIEEFKKHIFIAKRFGAPTRVINELSEIENNLTIQLNESIGDFSHLSLEDLEEKLRNTTSFEEYSKRNGNMFATKSPTAAQLKEIIEKRKL
ncbi:hypothetical protein [Limnohabitans sp. Jir72]|uniref:hypothetical protein n=1 Tax=Limnohabitans sp. Jir72 TaxID=1977909 RepID=UPI0011B27503|nr:hypothetical protein [Limnohabitans sp. Jir72]